MALINPDSSKWVSGVNLGVRCGDQRHRAPHLIMLLRGIVPLIADALFENGTQLLLWVISTAKHIWRQLCLSNVLTFASSELVWSNEGLAHVVPHVCPIRLFPWFEFLFIIHCRLNDKIISARPYKVKQWSRKGYFESPVAGKHCIALWNAPVNASKLRNCYFGRLRWGHR